MSVNTKDHKDHTRGLVLVWAGLMALTLLSWWFRDHGLSQKVAVATIIALSFVKVFMVGHSFMELKFAPRWLNLSFKLWCLVSSVVLVVMALFL